MPLFSKNGSIPKPTTDGTNGWVLVPEMPACPDGKEVVWLNWEWLVRDPKPTDREGYQWNWSHADKAWIEYALPAQELVALTTEQIQSLSTEQLSNLTTTGL